MHPGCRVGMPGLTAWAGGWAHRDLRGMFVWMHVRGGPPWGALGGGGAGGRTTAGYTVDYREKSAFLHMQNLLQPSVLFLSLLGNARPSPPPPLLKRNTTWHMRLTYQGQLNTYFSCLLSWRLVSVPFYFLVKYII